MKRVYEDDEEDNDGIVEEEEDEHDLKHFQSNSTHETITMPGREGNYALTQSIHQKYECRPQALKNMCLAQFAIQYDVFSGCLPKKTEMQDNVSKDLSTILIFGTEDYLPKFIKLKDEKHTTLKLRNTPKILRLHRKKMSHEQIYSEILLFWPYINESKELSTDATKCIELYERNKTIINQNMKSIFPFSQDMNLVSLIIESQEQQKDHDVYDTLDAAMNQENSDDADNLEPIDTSKLPNESETLSKPKDG